MNTRVILTALLCIGLQLISFAQAEDSSEKSASSVDIEQAADKMCNCVNTFLDSLHPQMKIMIANMDQIGQEAAMEKFAQYIADHPDEVEQILADAEKMEHFDTSIINIEGCNEMLQAMNAVNESQNNYGKVIKNYLATHAKCKFAYIFYKMGSEE